MKKKLFDFLIEGIEEESNNQDMASGDEVSLEKEAVRIPGERMVDASSINSLEFEALVTFLADRVLKIYPEDVKSSRFQITSEDSAILHPNAAPKVSLGFSDDGTHIDADYDDKLYFFVGYTLANFQRDFGTGEAGQINEQIKRMQIIAGLVREEYEEGQAISEEDTVEEESTNEGLYFVGYNKGRGQGTGVFKDSYSSYKDAKKAVEKIEKERGGSYNMIAYYVADKDGKFVREKDVLKYSFDDTQGTPRYRPGGGSDEVDEATFTSANSNNPEGDKLVLRFLQGIAKKYNYPVSQAAIFVKERISKLGY